MDLMDEDDDNSIEDVEFKKFIYILFIQDISQNHTVKSILK
jgi:hypothetical protein